MKCRLCKFLCDRFCPPDARPGKLWRLSSKWEQYHSNEWDLWDAQPTELREGVERALSLTETDAAKSFAIMRRLADLGSPFAARRTGWSYEHGWGTAVNLGLAELYYYKAQMGGSWMATLSLADLLYKHRINGKWEPILEDGVRSDFIPASFWLGWYRYDRNPKRSVAREVAPLIKYAAKAGHPGARVTLMRWKCTGVFGLRAVADGWRDFRSIYRDSMAGRLVPGGEESSIETGMQTELDAAA